MFEQMMELVTENAKRDGAIERDEFSADYGHSGWPTVADPEQRQKLEAFVLRKTPKIHQYDTADGGKGIVFFDHRGTAARCDVSKLEDAELVRIASVYGKRQAGEPNPNKPKTSATDHGYTKPVQEETELTEEPKLMYRGKASSAQEFMGSVSHAIDVLSRDVRHAAMMMRKAADKLGSDKYAGILKKAADSIEKDAKHFGDQAADIKKVRIKG